MLQLHLHTIIGSATKFIFATNDSQSTSIMYPKAFSLNIFHSTWNCNWWAFDWLKEREREKKEWIGDEMWMGWIKEEWIMIMVMHHNFLLCLFFSFCSFPHYYHHHYSLPLNYRYKLGDWLVGWIVGFCRASYLLVLSYFESDSVQSIAVNLKKKK